MSEWKKVKIGDFLTESKIIAEYSDAEHRITVRLNCKGIEKRDLKVEKEGATKYFIRKAGQFIYGKQNIHKGAFGIIPQELDGYTSSADLPSFDFDLSKCNPEWLCLCLKVDERYKKLQKNVKGVGSQRLAVNDFLKQEILLPDLSTQKEIVKVLSKKIEKVELIKSEIESQKSYAKKLRQNILQEAIEGKLTADWRKQHPVQKGNPDYDAEALLGSLQQKKESLKKDPLVKREKIRTPVSDTEKEFSIPNNWIWIRMGELCYPITKGTTPDVHEIKADGEIPYLKMFNIVNQKLDFDYRPQYISKKVHDEKLTRSKVYPNKLHETEVNIKKLITDDSIFCGLRKKLIKQNDFMLNDINSFPKEIHEITEEDTNSINLWKILLSNNKIISVWNNILVYYEEYGLDDSLIEFINNNIDEVSKSLLLKREELDDKENNRRKAFVNLFSDLLVCDLLSNDVFKTVTEKCPFIYKEINISELNESKVKILCENNKLSYNQTHINMIRDKAPEFLNIFINKNIKSALKKENINFITVNDIQNFLCSSEISNDSFISFIENENFLWEDIYNEKVSKKVINYVVEKSYRKKIAVQLSFVIKKMIEFEYKINQIIRFLNLQIDNYSTEEIKYSLGLLDSPYKNLFTKERKQLEMIQVDFNAELCNNLKNKNLISSYSKDSKGNIKINRKLK